MKKFFIIIIALYFILPYVVQAQPWSSGMNSVLKADSYSSATGSFEMTGPMLYPTSLGYSFNDVTDPDLWTRHGETPRNETINREGYMLHVYCSSVLNFSLYSEEKIVSTSAVSLFQLYSSKNAEDPYSRAKEILRDFYNSTSEVITDTVTTGSIYYGNAENPKVERTIITSGQIIISFDTKSCILTVSAQNLRIKDQAGQESDFILPEIKL